MTITRRGDSLTVSDIEELDAAHSCAFRSAITAAMPGPVKQIDIDLSRTNSVDCGGIGALISLRKRTGDGCARTTIRLRNPTQSVQRLLLLTRADGIFSVVDEL